MTPLLLLTALLAPASGAADREDAFQQAVLAELQAASPDAAARYEQADAAWKLGELSRAGTLFAQAADALPDSPHPLRRHCGVLLEAGMRDSAIERCRAALARAETPENQVALAAALLAVPLQLPVTDGDRREARALLLAARDADADDPMNAALRCHLAEDGDAAADIPLLEGCVADLDRLGADPQRTAFLAWRLAHAQGRYEDALAALDRAEAAGMAPEDARRFRSLTLREQGPPLLRIALGAGGGLVLFGLVQLLRRRR
ncbi:MAG: hypothetical protein H6742_21920 [Alphaproteobacteria bacterium]|nr:hypothetical protein [Alphaproteobacteria bacterium]